MAMFPWTTGGNCRLQPGEPVKGCSHRSFPVDAALWHQQLAVDVKRRGEGEVNVRPMPSPKQAPRVLLYGDYLSFGSVGVQPSSSANGQMLHGALEASSPSHAQGWLQALIIGVRTREITLVGVPVVLFVGKRASKRTADFPYP